MSERNPLQSELTSFFNQLDWRTLEAKTRKALEDPHEAIPLQTHCPAIRDLAQQVIAEIGRSAIQRPGELMTRDEFFNCDQRLVVFRILESVISAAEDWQAKTDSGQVTTVSTVKGGVAFPESPLLRAAKKDKSLSIPESPLMKGLKTPDSGSQS